MPRLRVEPTPSVQALKQAAKDRYSLPSMLRDGKSTRNKNKTPVDVKPLIALAAVQLNVPLQFDSKLKPEVKVAFREQFLDGGWDKITTNLPLDTFLTLLVTKFFSLNGNMTYPRPYANLLLIESPIFVTKLGVEWGRSDDEIAAVANVQSDLFKVFPILKCFLLPDDTPCANIATAMNKEVADVERVICEIFGWNTIDRTKFVSACLVKRKKKQLLSLANDFREDTGQDLVDAASSASSPGPQATEQEMWRALVNSFVLETQQKSLSKLLLICERVARRALQERIAVIQAERDELRDGLAIMTEAVVDQQELTDKSLVHVIGQSMYSLTVDGRTFNKRVTRGMGIAGKYQIPTFKQTARFWPI